MNHQPQTHHWPFWGGVFFGVVGLLLALAVREASLKFALLCMAFGGVVLMSGAPARRTGTQLGDRSGNQTILEHGGFASPHVVAHALAQQRRQTVAEIRSTQTQLVMEFTVACLLLWRMPHLWPWIVVVLAMSLYTMWFLVQQRKRLLELEVATANAKKMADAASGAAV